MGCRRRENPRSKAEGNNGGRTSLDSASRFRRPRSRWNSSCPHNPECSRRGRLQESPGASDLNHNMQMHIPYIRYILWFEDGVPGGFWAGDDFVERLLRFTYTPNPATRSLDSISLLSMLFRWASRGSTVRAFTNRMRSSLSDRMPCFAPVCMAIGIWWVFPSRI